MSQSTRQRVLQAVQSRGPISRKELTRVTGLSPASVCGITGAMIEQGLVQEVGEAEAKGRAGRKEILLKLNPDAGHVIGVKLSEHRITCVLVNLDARVLRSHDLKPQTDSAGRPDPEAMNRSIISGVEALLTAANLDRASLLGIGIGINGIVDTRRGVSVYANHFGWRDVPISEPLARHFGIPVFLENDACTLTIAEQWFGAGRGIDHFVSVAAGRGIGAGIVANGQVYRGMLGGAGEFGHIQLRPDGPPCSCGRHGCVESMAAIPGIEREIRHALDAGEPSSLRQAAVIACPAIADAAETGDALARRVLAEAGRWLGVGLACLVSVLSPQRILITGEVVHFGRWYLEPMEAALRATAFQSLVSQIQIGFEPMSEVVWARGAACVVLGNLLTSPAALAMAEPLMAAPSPN